MELRAAVERALAGLPAQQEVPYGRTASGYTLTYNVIEVAQAAVQGLTEVSNGRVFKQATLECHLQHTPCR